VHTRGRHGDGQGRSRAAVCTLHGHEAGCGKHDRQLRRNEAGMVWRPEAVPADRRAVCCTVLGNYARASVRSTLPSTTDSPLRCLIGSREGLHPRFMAHGHTQHKSTSTDCPAGKSTLSDSLHGSPVWCSSCQQHGMCVLCCCCARTSSLRHCHFCVTGGMGSTRYSAACSCSLKARPA
jgi:hypothetical protein